MSSSKVAGQTLVLSLLIGWAAMLHGEEAPYQLLRPSDMEFGDLYAESQKAVKKEGKAPAANPKVEKKPAVPAAAAKTPAEATASRMRTPVWSRFLPFGYDQFSRGKIGLGAASAGLQAAGLIYSLLNWTQYNSDIDATNAYIDQRNAEFEQLPASERAAHQQVTTSEVESKDAAAEQKINQATMGSYLFFSVWALSSIEAWMNPYYPESKGVKAKPKAAPAVKPKGAKKAALEIESEDLWSQAPEWHVGLRPLIASGQPAAGLEWRLLF